MDSDHDESKSSEDRLIEERKNQVKSFLFKNWRYLQYVLLVIIVWLGASIRSKPLNNLIDSTTGRYITLELDSTLWLRYAEYIAEHGRLFAVDAMRNAPLGGDLSALGTFTAYFIAYMYKIFNFFIPSITIEYVDIIYPIVATIVLSLFLFLLVRRLFDWRVGLLSVLFINLIPSFLFRSLGGSSDHDILGMMFFIMAIYFYVVAWQSKSNRNSFIFGIISGLITSIGLLTAGLTTFVFLIIGSFLIIELFLEKFDKKDYYVLVGWLGTIVIIHTLILQKTSIVAFLNSLTTIPAFFVLFASTFYLFVYQKNLFKIKDKIKFPGGLLSILIVGAFLLIVGVILQGGIIFVKDKFSQLVINLFETFQTNRWVTTVAENHKPFVTDWFGQMGKLYVFSFILGSVFLFYGAIKKVKKAKVISVLFGLFIFSFIFSRYSGNSVFNGESAISKFMLVGSLGIFLLIIFYLIIRNFYKDREAYDSIKSIDKKYIFIFIWFLFMALAATSAIRLIFEFAPITAIVVSFFVIFLIDLILGQKNKYLKFTGLLVILILLLNPFALVKGIIPEYYGRSLDQARFSGPGYNSLWQQTGLWVRENTPENAVFAHWWDYGYWVQSGFERPTITDGGNFIGWWNFLMGRFVLSGDSIEDSLKFLYAHNASYVLIVSDEIGKYPAYSLIGSDENLDRYSSVPVLGLDLQNSQETRNETLLFYRGAFALDRDLVFQDTLYPAGSAGIGAIVVPTKQNEDGSVTFRQPYALLVYQGVQINVPLNCLYFDNQKEVFNGEGLDACISIIPSFNNDEVNGIGTAIYLSEKVKDSFFARAYVGNEFLEGFELVYESGGQVPLGIYNGRVFGPHKIWKVNYPEDLELTDEEREYFLRISYPDESLL